jgi:dTDP-D-glucose 4,6-dehydratase
MQRLCTTLLAVERTAALCSGSAVLKLLTSKYPQYNFVNFDCLDTCATINNVRALEGLDNYKFVRGNILSSDLVNYILEANQIDTIMHFAAQSHVGMCQCMLMT